MKKILLFILLVFPLSMIISPSKAEALGVMPVVFDEIYVDPGDVLTYEVKVINDRHYEKTVYFSSQNFVASQDEDGSQEFVEEDEPTGLASWITPMVDSMYLEPREEKKLPLVISIPKDAEPGSHTAVFWTGDIRPDEEGGVVGVAGTVGVLFLINVSGDIIEDAEILEFNYYDKFQNRLPVEFFTRVQNKGTVHFQPAGQIEIKGLFGRTVATIDPNPLEANVLPNSVRKYDSWWTKAPPTEEIVDEGFFSALKNEVTNFGLGPYKAHLTLDYGRYSEKTAYASTDSFWVVPWRTLLVATIILLIVLFGIKMYNKTIAKSAVKKYTKKQTKKETEK